LYSFPSVVFDPEGAQTFRCPLVASPSVLTECFVRIASRMFGQVWCSLSLPRALVGDFICCVFFLSVISKGPPLWSSGQSSWLQIRRPRFDSRHYQKKVVGLERCPLSLVSTTEELLDRKVAAPVYKTENTDVEIRHADHVIPSIRKQVGNHFADKRRSLGRYISLADSDLGV
jgi:hypothetical protein